MGGAKDGLDQESKDLDQHYGVEDLRTRGGQLPEILSSKVSAWGQQGGSVGQ